MVKFIEHRFIQFGPLRVDPRHGEISVGKKRVFLNKAILTALLSLEPYQTITAEDFAERYAKTRKLDKLNKTILSFQYRKRKVEVDVQDTGTAHVALLRLREALAAIGQEKLIQTRNFGRGYYFGEEESTE